MRFQANIGGHKVNLALANITRGLKHKSHLPKNEGMLFVMGEGIHSFWMKDTYIPLDLIFLSNDYTIVGIIENAEPMNETPLSINQLSSYVIEVNAGSAAEWKLAPGAKIEIKRI